MTIISNRTVGGVLFGLLCLAALLSTFYTPYPPLETNFDARLAPPSVDHWLGTDQYGRDLFSRILEGAGVSLVTSLGAVLAALVCGVSIGAVAGYWGGWFDRLMTLVIDALMAFPALLLSLALMTVMGPSQLGIIIAIGAAYTPSVARVVRGAVLSLKEREFVAASRLVGDSSIHTLLRHVLLNCISPLTAVATSLLAGALLLESALSFLGLGVPPPAATWGGLLADGRQFMGSANWLTFYPGLAISLAVLGINLLGDALRDRFDPRMNNL